MIASVDRLFTQPAQHDPLGVQRRGAGVSGANGVDLGQVLALLGDVLASQREFRHDVSGQVASLRAEVGSLRADVASLRQDVAAYHASVVGHGILISELDGRVSRIEQHLDLPPAG